MDLETKIYLNKFKPRDYQLPVVDAIENKGYKRVLAIMPRRCLSGKSHILRSNGSYSLLQDLQPGDDILSWNGSAFVPDVVANIWKTGIKKTVEIRSYDYPGVISSYDHSFAITKPGQDSINWMPVQKIERNACVLQYAGLRGEHAGKKHCSILEAELYGYAISSVCNFRAHRITFSSTSRVILERISAVIEQLFFIAPTWREFRNIFSMFYTASVYENRQLFSFIFDQNLQSYCQDYKIPPVIWELDEQSLLRTLLGVLIVDGKIDRYKTRFLMSPHNINGNDYGCTEIILSFPHFYSTQWQFYWLIRKLGFVPAIPVMGEDHKIQIGIRATEDLRRLLNAGIFYGHEASQKMTLERLSHKPRDDRYEVSGCYKEPVRILSSEPEELYDVETKYHGNFVANGYLVHNSGKDIVAFNLAIRQCLRKPCVVYYIFPTYAQAKKVIWDSITNDGMRILDFIPPSIIQSSNSQEMKVRFINGSLLQLIGSDNIDAIVGTNPYAVIFSEYALQDPRAYQFIRPILTANDGWALFISCVTGNTLVLTRHGFMRIKDVCHSRSEYTPLNQEIYGLGGFHNAEQYYYGGKQPILKIRTTHGFYIECTPVHPLWNGERWVKAQDLRTGDFLTLQSGQNTFGKKPSDSITTLDLSSSSFLPEKACFGQMDQQDFYYLVGILQACGAIKDNYVVVMTDDSSIIGFLEKVGFAIDYEHNYSLFSASLIEQLRALGFVDNTTFIEGMLTASREQTKAFLRGFFDVSSLTITHKAERYYIVVLSYSLSLLRTLQIMLLNFGIVANICKLQTKTGNYILDIMPRSIDRFYRDIGFGILRKQWQWRYVPQCLIDDNPVVEKLIYVGIESIEHDEAEVYDFVIPDTHSFFSNGFISHNTPRGKNHLWDLYQIAQGSPLWFSYKLTVEDTNHIPLYEIERERQEGIMSEDLIQQEYYTSFTMGVEGAYYSKYLDKLRLSGQIGQVPWEVGFKVHTAWDLGVRDSTTIIFFQTIGQTIHIIDCYENSKEGLEHYIKIVKDKPYTYGKHIAPHDIRVREFTSGIARLDKARQLGISFTIAPDLSVIDGIEAVRTTLPKCWFDQDKCVPLLKALENYRQEYDSKRKVYRDHPLHDYSSHFADSFRYLCISLPKTRDGLSPEELEKRYRNAVYGEQSTMPSVFRDDLPEY